MKMDGEPLTIFPTELAKRRYERRRVLETGILDTSCLLTGKRLLDLCERVARRAGLLQGRTPGPAEMRLLLEEAAAIIPFAADQPLVRLSLAARARLLQQIVEVFSVFADEEKTLTGWLLAHPPSHKLHGFGQFIQTWRALCAKRDVADRFAVNAALFRLVQTGELPCEFGARLCFRAVRWLNPFEERFIAALKKRLGSGNVRLFPVLPAAHAEKAEDRFCAAVRSELMRGAEEEWKPWLEDFADALEVDDSSLLQPDSRERISFFVSAHPYGEIEDAARRIAREIEAGIPTDDIALIVRDLSPYTDIIPDVFRRFGIPYHFRRGTPAAALPPVKTLLALLSFPQTLSRDRLCDLLLTPGMEWPGLDTDARQTLAQEIRRKEPPRLRRIPKELAGIFRAPGKKIASLEFAQQLEDMIRRHGLILPQEVLDLIEEIGKVQSRPAPPERLILLFEELLDEMTIKDPDDTEGGVWVVNPLDAAGLRFDSVYIAGMDDRSFPQIPKADPLLNDAERNALHAFLAERGIPCPRLAFPEPGATLIQEEILFLTAISAARERLALSYSRAAADGRELAPGEFFERMRGLTGIEKPELGESFHTILPPEACRAEDEIRQTRAWLSKNADAVSAPRSKPEGCGLAREDVASLIQIWLENDPEFSATALETLACNRLVFFLEKILGIKPDRLHGDDTDPMDRGSLLHGILEQIYTTVAQQNKLYATPAADATEPACPQWVITRTADKDSIPLAVFDPGKADELLALARGIAEAEFRKAERRPSCHLGYPAVWETEKRKLLQMIENFVRMDIETAQAERRYPALFEMKFDAAHDLPVTLTHGGEQVQVKGKIDRIDLIFDSNGGLVRLLVVDYKSRSRNESADHLEKKIALNLDCQIPLYTFAAQQRFFGAHNTPDLNGKTQAVYHLQERDLRKMTAHFNNPDKRLSMTADLTEAFFETLLTNVRKLRAGDLAAEPLIAGYEDYSHICRTVAIDPEDLLK